MREMRRVLITGATGFIGGRLVERLVDETSVEVAALVRNFGHSSRIGRFAIDLFPGAVSDAAALDRALAGVDTVFHLAYDWGNPAGNIDAVDTLVAACRRAGVQRLVHASTISVYEPLGDGPLDESRPCTPVGWTYTDTKIEIERRMLAANGDGLEVTIVLPTIVYGPYGAWTAEPLRVIRKGNVYLPRHGEGLCNAVYVDDVVTGLMLAATRDEAPGERFLISGDAPITWGEYYDAFARIAGREQNVRRVASRPVVIAGTAQSAVKRSFGALKAVLKKAKRAAGPVGQSIQPVQDGWGRVKAHLRTVLPALPFVPEEQMYHLLSARAEVRIDKARALLGYEPRWSFERGMEATERYARWANLV